MSGPVAAKTCGLCGVDCANKPRTKDKSGKYFCRECYDSAVARKRGPGTSGTASGNSTLSSPTEDDLGLLGELLAGQDHAGAAVAAAGRQCTNCRSPLAVDAVICTRCGFNMTSGQQLNVAVLASKVERSGQSAAWPIPVGIVSMVLGGAFFVLHIVGLVMEMSDMSQAANSGTSASYRTGRMIGSIIPVLMMCWLFRGGYHLFRRNSSGVVSLRKWSFYQLILSALGIGCASMMLAGSERLQIVQGSDEASTIVMAAVVYSGTLAIWSIFLIIFTGLQRVKRDAARWG